MNYLFIAVNHHFPAFRRIKMHSGTHPYFTCHISTNRNKRKEKHPPNRHKKTPDKTIGRSSYNKVYVLNILIFFA